MVQFGCNLRNRQTSDGYVNDLTDKEVVPLEWSPEDTSGGIAGAAIVLWKRCNCFQWSAETKDASKNQ